MNQTFEVVLRAVPRQSLRARSKCESAPGKPGAPGGVATATVSTCVAATYENVTFVLSAGTENEMLSPPGTPSLP